jgi:four helix bundle protein
MTARYRHEDLEAWQKGVALAAKVYAASRRLPSRDELRLKGDLQRAAVAIPRRIAEGAARASAQEFVQFLHAALGSIATLETQIVIARDCGLVEAATLLVDLGQVRVLVQALVRAVSCSRRAAHARACSPFSTART